MHDMLKVTAEVLVFVEDLHYYTGEVLRSYEKSVSVDTWRMGVCDAISRALDNRNNHRVEILSYGYNPQVEGHTFSIRAYK